MSGTFKSLLFASVAISPLLAAATPSLAGAFAVREQSAEDLGDAFAGSATSGSSLSSMFWNPATLTSHQGLNTTAVGSGILPFASIQRTSPVLPGAPTADSGNIGEAAFVPSAAASYQVNDSIWTGISINSPFGFSTKAQSPWSGQVYGKSSDVRSLDIQPTVAFKLNDMLSFGAGLQIQRFSIHLVGASGVVPPSSFFSNTLSGDSWGVGFTAGATLTPMKGTEIGIGYRSQIKQNLKGTLVAADGLGGTFPINASVTLPDQVNIGLRQQVTQDFTALAGFEWTHWSIFNSFPVYSSGVPKTSLAFRYRNGWLASLGGEYKYSPNLTLRAGLAYEHTPISDVVRSVRLPDNNRIWTTVGLSYALDKKLSFDASYAHIFPASTKIAIVPGNPAYVGFPFTANVSSHIDIISVGLNYRWDNPKVMERNDLPKVVVSKY